MKEGRSARGTLLPAASPKLTYHDGPDVDEYKQYDVGEFLKRKDEGENVIGYALCKAIKWVKSVAGERSGHNPLVMGLVEIFIYRWVVKTSVNPVDPKVREAYEKWELYKIIESKRSLAG